MTQGHDSLDIQMKGASYGIRIVFPELLPDESLIEKFAAIPEQSFVLPIGNGVVLDFQSRPCSRELLGELFSKVLWPKSLKVLAWLTTDAGSQTLFDRSGFRTELPYPEEESDRIAVLTHALRSGQREEVPGDVVLVGHLNSGAEIFAGGSIFVLGKLKGLVHAGRNGATGACVVAGSFEPLQVRIGDKLCTELGEDMKWWKKPVILTVEDEKVLIRELSFMLPSERGGSEGR